MYCYNDFSKSDADLKAERIRMRYGVSSWPQLLFMDPNTLTVVHTGSRSIEGMIKAINDASGKVRKSDKFKQIHKDLAEAEELAAKLHKTKSVADARKHVKHADLVVRAIAIEILAKDDPDALLEDAEKLLDTPADQTRRGVCDAIVKAKALPKDPKVVAAIRKKLEALFKDPKDSLNPNVLRSSIALALGRIGTVESLEVLKPIAIEGAYFNGTTKVVDQAIGQIGAREKEALRAAVEILIEALPVIKASDGDRGPQYAKGLAEAVYAELKKLTELDPGFPGNYDDASRKELQEKFRAWLKDYDKKKTSSKKTKGKDKEKDKEGEKVETPEPEKPKTGK